MSETTLAIPNAPARRLPLAGLVVLVTGNIDGLTRDEAKEAVTSLGGTPAPGVSAKVSLIVLGEGAGVSKTAKARMLAIPVLDGADFAALTTDPTYWDGQPLGIDWDAYDIANPDTEIRVPATPDERAHWVGMGVAYVDDPNAADPRRSPGIRQVRFICACGHHWMRAELFGDDYCPRPEVPVTSAPWWPERT